MVKTTIFRRENYPPFSRIQLLKFILVRNKNEMARDRAIPQAIDQLTGELLIAEVLFKEAKHAAEVRKQYNENKLIPVCCECEQRLQISKSSRERHYFKHFQEAKPCFLKDSNLSLKESELISAIMCAKESERHKYLKNKISQLLLQTNGVVKDSVYTDDRFIFTGEQKRRPDVYCEYLDKKMVFEIQLSDLSYRYILDRHNFYKEKGIYLVWILDKFNVHGQSSMEKDIKYLTAYQNFFKLDESGEYFKLDCTYKAPFVADTKVVTPWRTKVVSLNEISFSPDTFQIYYHDFDKKLKDAQIDLAHKLKEIRDAYREPVMEPYDYDDFEAERLEEEAEELVADVIAQIGICRQKEIAFTPVERLLVDFHSYNFDLLNEKLGFLAKTPGGRPLMNHYIFKAGKYELSFISFLLGERRITMDINARSTSGTSIFQEIFLNKAINYREALVLLVFKRGYILLPEDITLYNSDEVKSYDKPGDISLFRLYQRSNDPEYIDLINNNKSLFHVIETARQKKMVGFRYPNWIAFGANTIHLHSKHWSYMENALRKYGVWNNIIQEDKKGTFDKKIIAFREALPDQDKTVAPVVKALYPELYS